MTYMYWHNSKTVINTHKQLATNNYKPSFLLCNGFLQTIYSGVISHFVKPYIYDKEVFKFEDGGQTYLDWKIELGATKGIVLVLPGLTGNSDATYVNTTVSSALENGFSAVV
jgi:predicted alpha/beta-fold hydrolase